MWREHDEHFGEVLRALAAGRLVPVLGPGINRSGRPDAAWQLGHSAPDHAELSLYLQRATRYPRHHEGEDLARVSQFVATNLGQGFLQKFLHDVVRDVSYPTPAHRMLAEMAVAVQRSGRGAELPLFVAATFDDLLERAMDDAAIPFDVISYAPFGEHAGRYVHLSSRGAAVIIAPNEYDEPSLSERAVILRPAGGGRDDYVVAEDDILDAIERGSDAALPVVIAEKLDRSSLLFLGYSPREWHRRALLRTIRTAAPRHVQSWAVEVAPDRLYQDAWRALEVDTVDSTLEEYVTSLLDRLHGHSDVPQPW